MKNNFEQYSSQLVLITLGFKPVVRVEEMSSVSVRIFLDGNEVERKMMMGRHGKNLAAMRKMLDIFSRQQNASGTLYIEFPKEMV